MRLDQLSEALLDCDELSADHAGDQAFAKKLEAIVQFTQLLFDDDENLTRTGNLNGAAKTALEERIREVFEP